MFIYDSSGKIQVDPDVLIIPAFHEIYKADKKKDKSEAFNTLAGIFFISDYKSPYADYPDSIKEASIISDQKLPKDFFKKESVKEAIKIYKENQLNAFPTLRLLNSTNRGIETLCKRLEDPNAKSKELIDSIGKIRDTIRDYNAIKKEVFSGVTGESKRRGGDKAGVMFEEPD